MIEVKKKIWPKYFQEILEGKINHEVRLADFDINEGDILVLEEYDPVKKEKTGRVIKKTVKNLTKWNPTEVHSLEDIKKYGFYEIELE